MHIITDLFFQIIHLFQTNPWAQLIGFAGFGMSLLTFLSNNNEKFMIRMTMSSFIWAIHFLLLGALSAGFLNAVDVIKNLLAIKYPFNKKISFAIVIVYIFIGFYLYSYIDKGTESAKIINLIPVVASILSTIILFTLKGVWMRIAFTIMLLGWFTYNISNGSIGGALTDLVLFITGLYGIHTMSTNETEQKKK
ncbi:TPA: YgjV family protein [Candidatus Gracilibacteria bacterium]|nr:YgjV family protein [Candidatus Peregrinibacteria bacterium]HIQ56469.1 YgjV family protein [Candidatus Gracilibacteria bacterium]HIQ57769.1 YgjV family protein [Candidatus Gracilibacteria bacterium]